MRRKIKKIALRSGAFFLFLFFIALISLPNLVDLENYRSLVVAAIQGQVAGTVTVRRLKLYLDREIGVKIVGFSLTDGDQQQIKAEEVKIGFHIWPLLHRQLQVSSVRLIRPLIHLQAIKGEPFGSGLFRQAETLFPAKPYCTTISTGDSHAFIWCNNFNDVRLQIKKGMIAFTDRHFCAEPVTTRLQKLDFFLHLSGSSKPAPFSLSAATVTKRQAGHLRIEGSLQGLSWPLNWGRMQLDCQVHGQNLDGDQYWPYYQKHVPMRHVGARVAVDGSYQGNLLGHFISRGSIVLDDADLDFQRVFSDRLPIRHLTIDYRFQLVKDYITVDVPEVQIESDDFSVRGSCRLEGVRRGKQGSISARFSSNQLDLEQIYRYLPIKIMPAQFRQFWQEQKPRGLVQIHDAYLQGSYDQIAGIGRRKALSPSLIGGTLRLSGVSLKIPGMSGRWQNLTGELVAAGEKIRFSHLHCDLPPFLRQQFNGSLSSWHHEPRLALVDSFTLNLPDEPQLNDQLRTVVDMLGQRLPKLSAALSKCQQLGGSFAGTLKVEGSLLPVADLDWQLDGAGKNISIRHPDIGRPLQKLSGKLQCTPRRLDLQHVSVMVGNSPVTLDGTITDYRDLSKVKLDISLGSSAFLPADLDIIPHLKIKVSSTTETGNQPLRFKLKINGFLRDPASIQANGQLNLRHLVVSAPWLSHDLDDLTLFVDCRGRKVMVRELSFRSGSSEVKLSGDFSAGSDVCQLGLNLESGYFDFKDFLDRSWQKLDQQQREKRASLLGRPLSNMVLKFSLRWPTVSSAVDSRDGQAQGGYAWWQVRKGKVFPDEFPAGSVLRLNQLSFVRGRSDFFLAGRLQVDEQGNIHGSLKQTSGQLQVADFFSPTAKKIPLWERLEKYRGYLLGQDISCSSHIDHYVSRNIILEDMDCQAVVSGNLLKIKSLNGSVWEGKTKASYSWDLDQDTFSLALDLQQVDLSQFNQSLALYSEKSLPLEGKGMLQLNLKWDGNDKLKWRRSLNGQVSFAFVKGRLKRFKALANIASLLNVSQLLTFHLPDLSKGVPYDSLNGSFKIENGILKTDDLLLKGPAVNISSGGTISLPERQVDMEVGIQPLQTIDKVIAAVPIVGYIVTGEGKTFIVMRFSIRGPFGKTTVAAIPVRGLVGKTGGILKRLITTPVRVLSWPGKILSPAKKEIPATPGTSGTAEDKRP